METKMADDEFEIEKIIKKSGIGNKVSNYFYSISTFHSGKNNSVLAKRQNIV